MVGKMVAIMLNFVLKTLHKCDRCSVVAVRFFSFLLLWGVFVGLALFAVLWVGFSSLCKVNLACLAKLVCLVSLACLIFVVLVLAWPFC